MCRIFFAIVVLALTSPLVMAQMVNNDASIINKGKLSEQAAICAAYAIVMEKVTLINPKDSLIWELRRNDITNQWQQYLETQTGQIVTSSSLNDIVKNYGRWMTDKIFFPDPNSQETVSPSSEESVQQYITTFCPAMFRESDTRIAMARPDLFMAKKLAPENNDDNDDNYIASANGLNVPHQLSDSLIDGRGMATDTTTQTQDSQVAEGDIPPSPDQQPQVIIQLAAYKLLIHAESGLDVFRLKMGDMASPPRLVIEAPENSDEGYFRVVSIPMGRDDAKAACALLEKRQIGCIIRSIE
ncbi:hypothetical protein OAR27_00230 [Alphaproteobacteria bacterium]|nr:hypothetical protein [Pseudomonadota bacterium]MDC1019697.1 hypothetical protein [Alphaproteobacteria bacterium]